jgi:hypothetical protein
VLVEGPPGYRRVARDVSDRGAGVAVFGDRLRQPGDQALALVASYELAGKTVPPRGKAGELGWILRRVDRGVDWFTQENRRYRFKRLQLNLAN